MRNRLITILLVGVFAGNAFAQTKTKHWRPYFSILQTQITQPSRLEIFHFPPVNNTEFDAIPVEDFETLENMKSKDRRDFIPSFAIDGDSLGSFPQVVDCHLD